jgi:outer membrane immunogenic protein
MRDLLRLIPRLGIARLTLALGFGWFSVVLGFAQAAPGAQSASIIQGVELGAGYNYVRQCGCFSLNGGKGWFAVRLTHSVAVVAEVSSQGASNIRGSDEDLTLTSYLFGPRFSMPRLRRFAPFGQVLLGRAHANGSEASFAFPGSSNAFAMIAGAGFDVGIAQHFAVRPVEADYFLTHFANSLNEPQNYLRLSAGVVFRFGEK